MAKYFLADNFNALILILSKNLLLNVMLLCSALPFLLGKPLLKSSGSRPDAFSVSQQQNKTDVCMTLAHLFPLLFTRVHCFVLSLLFLEVFLFLSFPVYFFPVIPKAVVFLVVIGIVVCGFAD